MCGRMNSTREAYGAALVELAGQYDFFVMDADLAKATQTVHFSKQYPERFIDMGIAEANLIGFAAGMSTFGTPVFASTFAAFAAGRAYDQVRNTLAYSNCNVKIGATHAGVLIGADGGSHQCIEDIALMRAIPNMTVLCPCDTRETRACVKAALEMHGPVYLRFGRLGTPEVYEGDAEFSFEIGKGHCVREGADLTIVAIGDMVSRSLEAARALESRGISARVIDMASIKPIDEALILSSAAETGCFVTAEDHNVLGGLGSAVCEVLAKHAPCPVETVGVQDCFGRSGDPAELAEAYGLTASAIEAAALRVLERKRAKA